MEKPGGCIDLEDPDRDARAARPQWTLPAVTLTIVPVGLVSAMAPPFTVWQLPGPKVLSVCARHDLALATGAGGGGIAVTVDADLLLGDAYAFRVPAAVEPKHALPVMDGVRSAMQGIARPASATPARVNRTTLVHLRALQALDGVSAGASHRTIARVLFGTTAVTRRWSADGELRAQLRYLLRRARALRDGGYRRLLLPSR